MLTNETVLTVFADYLSRDADFEVILTSRGYTVMGWDKYREDWNTVEYCPTPEVLRDALLDAYTSFREMEVTDGERDLTAMLLIARPVTAFRLIQWLYSRSLFLISLFLYDG